MWHEGKQVAPGTSLDSGMATYFFNASSRILTGTNRYLIKFISSGSVEPSKMVKCAESEMFAAFRLVVCSLVKVVLNHT